VTIQKRQSDRLLYAFRLILLTPQGWNRIAWGTVYIEYSDRNAVHPGIRNKRIRDKIILMGIDSSAGNATLDGG